MTLFAFGITLSANCPNNRLQQKHGANLILQLFRADVMEISLLCLRQNELQSFRVFKEAEFFERK